MQPQAGKAEVESGRLSKLPASKSGVRVTIRGRSVKLRGLHHPPTGLLAALAIFGPGLIAATAGDDAGGVATYSQVGAKYGYDLLWVLLLITISLAVVQETVCSPWRCDWPRAA